MSVKQTIEPTHEGWEDDWIEAFAEAAQKGADAGTAQAIAWAKVQRQRTRNPAAAREQKVSRPSRRRARLGIVPPLRKGKLSTWKETASGKHRARLGTLPQKWREEWARQYRKALKVQQKRRDLAPYQQKTIASKKAWFVIKKQGCRLPKGVRPLKQKSVVVAPNKRARDRDKRYGGWVCPEWESTEVARKRFIEELRRAAKRA